jgi:beta-mannosidase
MTKQFEFIIVLLFIFSIITANAKINEYLLNSDKLKNDQSWILQQCFGNNNIKNTKFNDIKFTASVPGVVYTDLMKNGFITENPLFRYNEVDTSDVAKSCWSYTLNDISLLNFDLSSTGSPIYISFSEIDTKANIYFNDILIGTTSNSFKSYSFRIPNKIINNNNNTLYIEINSAVSTAKEGQASYPYQVPHTENYNVWTEPSHRNFIRKAGSDFGWDWGPAFVPTGIGFVSIKQPTDATLDGIVIKQKLTDDLKNAQLNIYCHFKNVVKSISGSRANVYMNDILQFSSDIIEIPASITASATIPADSQMIFLGSIDINDVNLWWPREFGDQYLYSIKVQYEGNGGDSSSFQDITRAIGVRKVELVQINEETDSKYKPMKDKNNPSCKSMEAPAQPATFYFKVNNISIFCRGSNFIPIDVFKSKITRKDREFIIQAALESNMNMLRVWGGGIYQPDDLYELADKYGIMIWQEIMLACALYPRDKTFLSDVSTEVQQQVLRLSTHPSIIIFGGNNENEVALTWFTESQVNRDLYVADYVKLYGDTVYQSIQSIDNSNTQAWVDSSPSNGMVALDPYVKLWTSASTSVAGDMHFYDYNCDCEEYKSFPDSRFISEFGFQSMPSFLSYKPVTIPSDWDKDSDLLLFRQRHENGNEQIETQIKMHFNLPNKNERKNQKSFDSYLYLTQIQQSRCYETAINRWRQLRSTKDVNTMGILYWQLNDIWQGPSWSSIEYGGRFKPLQYSVKRAYSPIVVTFSGSISSLSDEIQIYSVNDYPNSSNIDVSIHLMSWKDGKMDNSNLLWQKSSINIIGSVNFVNISVSPDVLSKHGCTVNTCFLQSSSTLSSSTSYLIKTIPSSYFFLTTIKESILSTNPTITINNYNQLSSNQIEFYISVDQTSPFLFMEIKDYDEVISELNKDNQEKIGVFGCNAGWFSDNNFVAIANNKYLITYTSYSTDLNINKFQNLIQARVLQDVYN